MYSQIKNSELLNDKWKEEYIIADAFEGYAERNSEYSADLFAGIIRTNFYKAEFFKERAKEIYVFLNSIETESGKLFELGKDFKFIQE